MRAAGEVLHRPLPSPAAPNESRILTPLTERTRAALQGRYDIEREVGHGGMATVFLARDLRHDRPVAVKVLHPDLAAAIGTERFLREVRITARLSHPHILPLLDSGESDGLLYYVMPFVEGESLRARLDARGALPVPEALAIAREVGDALGYAHGRGIVHRDVKPENILLESGHALVGDFGIARAVDEAAPERLTATGLSIGTPHYMSPEQIEGSRDVDARSDLYSLGCVLYEMLAGTPPHSGPSAQAIVTRRLTEPAPSVRVTRDTVPPALDATVQRALARMPGDRHQTASEFVAALEPAAATAPRAAAISSPRRGWQARASVGIAGVAAIAALVWLNTRREPATPAAVGADAIAVLPFVNLTADTAQAYFADGLTDELISSLSLVEGVRVASRTSSFAFRRTDLDVREIGQRLGVQSVIEGSVRRGNGRVRVSARLVSVADGLQQWSQAYDKEEQDALVIQEEIARAIVETLKGRLGSSQQAAVSAGTTDPQAYDLYLRGRFFRNKRTEEGLRRAIDLLGDAVERAPGFARAHAGLAESYAVMGFYDVEPPRQVFPKAAAAATEALRLDPNLGSAHATLGYCALYHDWDWARAEREFRRAIELEPNYATAHQWFANHLTAMGRFDEAERAMRQAISLDPFSLITNAALGWVFYHAGSYDRAMAQFRSTSELDSTFALTHLWEGQTLEALGRTDDAVAAFRRGVRHSGEGAIYLAALARALALRGELDEVRRLLERIDGFPVVPSYEVAKVHEALGDRAMALRLLERAYEERSHSMAFLKVDPELASLRNEPRFLALVQRVGL